MFLAFTVFTNESLHSINAWLLLTFLEFLVYNGLKHSAIANYLSAVKAMCTCYGLQVEAFEEKRIHYFMRSLQLNRPYNTVIKPVIHISTLHSIVKVCDSMYMGIVYKAAYLLAFFFLSAYF